MKSTKILIKALNFDRLPQQPIKKQPSTQRSNSNKIHQIQLSVFKSSSRRPTKAKITLNIRPKSTLKLIQDKTLPISRNRFDKSKNFLTTTSNRSTNSFHNPNKKLNKNLLTSFTLYNSNNSYSSTSRNSRNYKAPKKYLTAFVNTSGSINSSNPNVTFGPNHFNNTSGTINANNTSGNLLMKKIKNNSVLKTTIKKKLFIKNFYHSARSNLLSGGIKFSGDKKLKFIQSEIISDGIKEKIDKLKQIKFIKIFMKTKIFCLWKKYYKKKKRVISSKTVSQRLTALFLRLDKTSSNIIKKKNKIWELESKINEWGKNSKLINTEKVDEKIFRNIVNEFISKIKEINTIISDITAKTRYKCANISSGSVNINSISCSITKSKILKVARIAKNKNLFSSCSPVQVKGNQGSVNLTQKSDVLSIKTKYYLTVLSSIKKYILEKLEKLISSKLNRFHFLISYTFNENCKRNQSTGFISLLDELKKSDYYGILGRTIKKIKNTLQENDKKMKDMFSHLSYSKDQNSLNNSSSENIVINGNIINDFSKLQKEKIIQEKEDISKLLSSLEQKLLTSNDKNVQQLKKELSQIKNIISSCDEKSAFFFQERIDNISEQLDARSEAINKKYSIDYIKQKIDEISHHKNVQDLIMLIEIVLVRYNILYDNFNDVLINLNSYFSNFGNKKLLEIPKLYQELVISKNITYESIQFKILFNEYIQLLSNDNNFLKTNFFTNFNKAIDLRRELDDLYKKLSNNNELSAYYVEICNLDSKIEDLKLLFIYKIFHIKKCQRKKITKVENIFQNIPLISNKVFFDYKLYNKDFNDIYCKFIWKNIKLNFILKNDDFFKNNTYQSNDFIINLLNKVAKNEINFTSKDKKTIIDTFSKFEINKDNTILKKLSESLISKKIVTGSSTKNGYKLEYSKLYLLEKEELNTIAQEATLTSDIITKVYSKINKKQKLLFSKNQITGIKSYLTPTQYEIFSFLNPVSTVSKKYSCSSPLFQLSKIYCAIDNEIAKTLSELTLISLSEFSSKSFINWINSNFSQVSICSLSLIFTNEISQLLVGSSSSQSHQPPKKVQNNQVKKEFEMIINKYTQWLREKEKLNLNLQTNIILTLINQLNIVETLLSKNIRDVESFDWLKYIRHLWDQSRKEVIIECGGWTNYQMKKIVSTNRILLTPDTDKVFLFTSSCFREKSASIIKLTNNGQNNIESYRQIFEEYCSLFWTEMISIDVSIKTLNDIKNIFDIATNTKTWIYLNGLDSLNLQNSKGINYLIYLSKFMQIIQQEVILNDIKSEDNSKMFCLMGCILIDDDIKNKENYMKSSSRILNFIKPDMKYYLSFIKRYNDKNTESTTKIIEFIIRSEKEIRNKLGSFYYDFDFYNGVVECILNSVKKNYSNLAIETFLNDYIHKYSFTINDNSKLSIISFFDSNGILYSELHVELFNYLVNYLADTNSVIAKKPVITGFGNNFIVQQFKLFSEHSKLQFKIEYINNSMDLSSMITEGGNDKVVYISNIGEISQKEIIEKYKVFTLPLPKNKKLLKSFFERFKKKLADISVQISDEYYLTLLEFINNIIKVQQNQQEYHKIAYNFYKWSNILLNYFLSTFKKVIINDQILFNIILQSILFTFNQTPDLIQLLSSLVSKLINSSIAKEFQLVSKKGKNQYLIYSFEKQKFLAYDSYPAFVNSFIKYAITIVNNTEPISIIQTEYDANINKEINNEYLSSLDINKEIKEYPKEAINNTTNTIYYYISKTNDKTSLLPIFFDKKLKLFIGMTYQNFEYEIQEILSNENVKSCFIRQELKNELIPKFCYILSLFEYKKLSHEDLKFIYGLIYSSQYGAVNWDKLNINYEKVSDYEEIIRKFCTILSKNKNHIKSNNKFLKKILKKILKKFRLAKKFTKEEQNINILDFSNEILVKNFIFQYLKRYHQNQKIVKDISKKINLNKDTEIILNKTQAPITDQDIIKIVKLIVDFSTDSEYNFGEKYEKENYLQIIHNFFIDIILTKDDYNLYYKFISDHPTIYNQTELLIEYISKNKIESNLIFFHLQNSKISSKTQKEVQTLMANLLSNYRFLITDKNEFNNTKNFYFNSLIKYSEEKETKGDYTNFLLEKIYLSVSNHFLLALVSTFEIMLKNFEISNSENEYIMEYLQKNFCFPADNSIKFKHEKDHQREDNNQNQAEISNFIIKNGKRLIELYKKNKNIDNSHFALLTQSILPSATKYFYTNNVSKIEKDVDKLLYYITFIPEQSPSVFKYLITKYLLPMYSINKFTVNNFLKNPYGIPITIKASPNINVTNFLCSLAAYYEIQFFIIRSISFEKNASKVQYKYIIDYEIQNLLKDAMIKGYWIFISDTLSKYNLLSILYQINNFEKKLHKNFKLFFDQKLIEVDCQNVIQNMTMLLQIENENVDDLEAAHDIWVNVLEEKLLTESIMDETQKDFLDINSNFGKNNVSDITEVTDPQHQNILSNGVFSDTASQLSELNILNNF